MRWPEVVQALLVVLLLCLPGAPAVPCASSRYDNLRLSGGQEVASADEASCCTSCEGTPSCAAWSWLDSRCLHTTDELVASKSAKGSVLGLPTHATPTVLTVEGCQCKPTWTINITDGMLWCTRGCCGGRCITQSGSCPSEQHEWNECAVKQNAKCELRTSLASLTCPQAHKLTTIDNTWDWECCDRCMSTPRCTHSFWNITQGGSKRGGCTLFSSCADLEATTLVGITYVNPLGGQEDDAPVDDAKPGDGADNDDDTSAMWWGITGGGGAVLLAIVIGVAYYICRVREHPHEDMNSPYTSHSTVTGEKNGPTYPFSTAPDQLPMKGFSPDGDDEVFSEVGESTIEQPSLPCHEIRYAEGRPLVPPSATSEVRKFCYLQHGRMLAREGMVLAAHLALCKVVATTAQAKQLAIEFLTSTGVPPQEARALYAKQHEEETLRREGQTAAWGWESWQKHYAGEKLPLPPPAQRAAPSTVPPPQQPR